jgi:acyl-CoA synthetase (AMP-forming)/AMP-acid ligase II
VVLRSEIGADADRLRAEILNGCKEALPQYKIPALLRFVTKLDIAESGKLVRPHA